jgi:endonuclease YncB( thermonuclease family)
MWMRVENVYDGDTITVSCIYKTSIVRWRCRMMGYDSPEMRTKNESDKKLAIDARDFLKTLLPKGLFRGQCRGLDKYGRLLLDLKCAGTRTPISSIMITNGHGYKYDGGTKRTNVSTSS